MKMFKMLGIAVVAALAAMAFVGSGTAIGAPTTLCSANESPCPEGKRYGPGTVIKGSTKGVVVSGWVPFTCTEAAIEGETTGVGNKKIAGKLTSLTFGKCTEGLYSSSCQFSTPNLPAWYHIKQNGKLGDGTMWVGPNAETQGMRIRVVCASLGTTCTYAAQEVQDPNGIGLERLGLWAKLAVKGGSPASMSMENVVFKTVEGSNCGGQISVSTIFSASSPTPLYVEPPQAELCKTNESPCAAAQRYGSGTTIGAALATGTEAVIGGSVPINCKKSGMAGKVGAEKNGQVRGELTGFTFEECKEQLFNTTCTVSPVKTPYEVRVAQAATAGDGTMWVGPNSKGEAPTTNVGCSILGVECTLKANEVLNPAGEGTETGESWAKFDVTGGNPASAAANSIVLKSTKNTGTCGTSATLKATYSIASPNPLWVM